VVNRNRDDADAAKQMRFEFCIFHLLCCKVLLFTAGKPLTPLSANDARHDARHDAIINV